MKNIPEVPALPRSETKLKEWSPQAVREQKTERCGQFTTNANSEEQQQK